MRRVNCLTASLLALTLVGCAGAPSSEPAMMSAAPPISSIPAESPTGEPSPSALPIVGDSFAVLGAEPARYDGTIACSGAIGDRDPLAIVERATGEVSTSSLVDFADPARPRVACTLGKAFAVDLIDAHHLVVQAPQVGDLFAIVDLPEVRYHWFRIPASAGSFPGEVLAVAPTLDEIAWNEVRPGDGPVDRIHLATVGRDQVIATLPDTNEGSCGWPTDSNRAAYTRSGSALFVLDEPHPEVSLIVVKDGRVALSLVGTAKARLESRPLQVLWSATSETLFWTQGVDVWRWTDARGRGVYLAGVTWSSATISPDGTELAYDVIVGHAEGANGGPPSSLRDVYLVDLAGAGKPVRIGQGHAGWPVFLDDGQLWYLRESQAGGCGEWGLTPAIHDLASGTDALTDIDRVDQIWPATGTNN
jgi:hypothetical protein